ncbi:hypothetical protein B6U90_03405 [Thermoplasmatales archaeon ex4484_6]|nr:MAG: hypothetical protein B6U90_03405 [Thermoplasmatales archaeon ex4484_6]RLF68575.1 MAG: hypothetical protein DRN57_03605 [Thermoplasmata archaeon]
MGLEFDRVLGGLKRFPTNRIILLYGNDTDSNIERKARKNGKRIREVVSATIDVEEMEMDIFDFFQAARTLNGLFRQLQSQGHSIYVNLSTGNRIVSSAALLACYMTRAHPYYVRPESYHIPENREVISTGVLSVIEMPMVRIIGPTRKGQIVLAVLSDLGGEARYESSLIPPLERRGGFFPERKLSESKKAYLARKRAHLSRVLRSLEKDGYIQMIRKGRFVSVVLTESGKLFSISGDIGPDA